MALLLNFLRGSWWWDIIVFVVITIINVISWIEAKPGLKADIQDTESRKFGATSMISASTAGITAGSILIPASLLIVQLGLGSNSKPLPQVALNNVFEASLWFLLSLLLGLYIIWTVVMRSQRVNVTRDFRLGVVYGPQFFALFLGVLRLVLGISAVLYR
jgi:hypothetical protein